MFSSLFSSRWKKSCAILIPGLALLTGVLSANAADLFPEPVFVSQKLANTVERFPAESVWKGGPNMLYTTISPDGKLLLATSPNTASVYAFNTSNGKQRAIIKVGKASKGIKISPSGKEAYVSNEGANSISVINLSSLNVIATISTGKKPHNVRFNTTGSLAYVTLQGGEGLGVIDTKKRKMIKVIPIPGIQGPHNLDLSADDKIAYVRDIAGHVAVLELDSGNVKKVINVGAGHAGIDITPNGKYIFTAAIADDMVIVIDPATLLKVKSIKVGFGSHGVRASADSRWVYVTVTTEDKVVVIDTQTLSVVKEYKTGSFPFWIAVNGNP